MLKDDFAREDHFQKVAQEGARIGVIRAKRLNLPLLRPKGFNSYLSGAILFNTLGTPYS